MNKQKCYRQIVDTRYPHIHGDTSQLLIIWIWTCPQTILLLVPNHDIVDADCMYIITTGKL